MRLINTTTLEMREYSDNAIPQYAILSHRWTDDEITYKDYIKGRNWHSIGYRKVLNCCNVARTRKVSFVWIDTCCIDKRSSAELSEAINLMYRWYELSLECYVHLSDVQTNTTARPDLPDLPWPSPMFLNSIWTQAVDEAMACLERSAWCANMLVQLRRSQWFTRGWTLQELIAPANVLFYDVEWRLFGAKHHNQTPYEIWSPSPGCAFVDLTSDLYQITGIPEELLKGRKLVTHYSIAQRLSWASQRGTSRVEDMTYCLLGLLDVNMPLLYGEGTRAWTRLQEHIIRSSNDESIFAWFDGEAQENDDDGDRLYTGPILTGYVLSFHHCGGVTKSEWFENEIGQPNMTLESYTITNQGLEVRLDCREAIRVHMMYELSPENGSHQIKRDVVILPIRCSLAGRRASDLACRQIVLVLIEERCGHYSLLYRRFNVRNPLYNLSDSEISTFQARGVICIRTTSEHCALEPYKWWTTQRGVPYIPTETGDTDSPPNDPVTVSALLATARRLAAWALGTPGLITTPEQEVSATSDGQV